MRLEWQSRSSFFIFLLSGTWLQLDLFCGGIRYVRKNKPLNINKQAESRQQTRTISICYFDSRDNCKSSYVILFSSPKFVRPKKEQLAIRIFCEDS